MTNSILESIGNTPLVEIRKLNPNSRVKILAKLEYFNPGGSVKDRAALSMIEDGEKSGKLTHSKTVIEATSGNTGIGLALVCAVKGYRLLLTMSESVSIERQKILKARGAELLLTPGHLGTDGAIEEAYRLARENPETYFMTDQYNNEANWKCHYCGTAEEIWQQTQGKVTMIVATMGTTGTLMGVSRRLKAYRPDIQIVGVEPYLGHKIQGLKNMKEAYCPEIFEKKRLDKKINIEDEEAFEMTRRLAKTEGLFVGMSSGAALAVARKEAESLREGIIVVVFPDNGERYLSTSLFTVRDKMTLNLFNTMDRAKGPFEPSVPGKVSLYTCGPAAHSRIHIGECRRFVFADMVCRYLVFRGYDVNHIMNIADLDDKTLSGSEQEGIGLSEFAQKHIQAFHEDLKTLSVMPAAKYPRASEHIEDMVQVAGKLVKKGYAYEKLRSLYFDVSRSANYGKLSGINIDKIKLGATVDLDEYEKDNPRDFTLLKRSRLSELKRGIYTKTEWGNIRPSWNIQCAAMSMKYLGDNFDIHVSSRELVFPHHENENAIAEALTGKALARYWIHCGPILVDAETVDEKRGSLTLADLIDMNFSGKEIRYWLLLSHYRKPATFSRERLEDARQSLNRMNACIHSLIAIGDGRSYGELEQLLYDIKNDFISAMDDDLNISAAIASLFKRIKQINTLLRENRIDREGAIKIVDAFRNIDSVLGLFNSGDNQYQPDIMSLVKEREQARKEKNWILADQIRDRLRSRGIHIQDRKI